MINGGAMRFGLRREMEAVLGTMPPDVTDPVAAAMRRKSPRELALVREACASLQAAFAAMRDAGRAGRGMTDIVLAGERAAWRRGAQDVRTLFGRNGGLSPFTVLDAGEVDPLQVYAAVRHDGYWAEGFGVLSSNVLAAADAARAILGQAESRMRPGALLSEVAKFLADAIGLRRAHPLVDGGFGQHMGLRLQGPDSLKETSTARFAVGEVYTVRVALDHGAAIVSAMVAITDNGHEVLWRGDDA
jgi:Xaa-Pro aminopeptidase